jgi:hypothetical protein
MLTNVAFSRRGRSGLAGSRVYTIVESASRFQLEGLFQCFAPGESFGTIRNLMLSGYGTAGARLFRWHIEPFHRRSVET